MNAIKSSLAQMKTEHNLIFTGSADLLEATRIKEVPLGVQKTEGFCRKRVTSPVDDFDEEAILEALISESGNGTGIETVPDSAYSLSQRAILSVNTGQIFPEGFPSDFSIISTFKPVPDSQSVLFSVYNDAGDEQLALEIDDRIILVYQVFIMIPFKALHCHNFFAHI